MERTSPPRRVKAWRTASIASMTACAALALAGCGRTAASEPTSPAAITTVRIGFFPNLTHAPAMVGIQEGIFRKALEPEHLSVTPVIFNAGPEAVTALFAGSLDIAYLGPNPTINAYVESKGTAIRVIAGAASGGAALVVKASIASPADLKGRKLATPQLGNTQDVALRSWLRDQGLTTNIEGGGDVSVVPQSNAAGLTAFSAGHIDGAWVPQPWVEQYVRAGAKVLVDEASLWPRGEFVTTNVVVRTQFLSEHPDAVAAFLDAHVASLAEIEKHPGAAAQAVGDSLRALTGSAPDTGLLRKALADVNFTADPLPATLKESADKAVAVGLLDAAKLTSAGGLPGQLYELAPLDAALKRAGKAPVSR